MFYIYFYIYIYIYICNVYVFICIHKIKYWPKKNSILPFAATWMDQKVLSEISQRKEKNFWFHFYMDSKKQTEQI